MNFINRKRPTVEARRKERPEKKEKRMWEAKKEEDEGQRGGGLIHGYKKEDTQLEGEREEMPIFICA